VAAKTAGYFHNGLPYNRLGHGARKLVVFQGLLFENKPQAGPMVSGYKFLGSEYTTWVVLRKLGMPHGYTLQDMADDYATMIKAEFDGPVDVIGVSTGGSIALHFAAKYPELVRRLVIHSSAYVLSEDAKSLQLQVGSLAQKGKWTRAYAAMIGSIFPSNGAMKLLFKPIVWLAAVVMGIVGVPKNPSDLVVTIEAEDQHNFREYLTRIMAPTLVVAGDQDPFYTATLCRETATGIPNARLILYPRMGHPASGKQFGRDVLAFLNEGLAT
jgi:pimeloyl-ACP methyl ester carboxylesterase